MLSELTSDMIESMLGNQYYGRIACAAGSRILIEPMMYYYDGHYIYGLTRQGTKTQLLHQNPNVAFEIDEAISLDIWRSVVIEGVYEELQEEDRDYALYLLKKRKIPVFADERFGYPDVPVPADLKVIYPVVYRIQIMSKTGRCYQRHPHSKSVQAAHLG
ncbi:pyridoxamine 5'-phosphate oxidase family protein [Spirosoma radiotolerans]|uniref:pyridoxamine 5'-phosphate oxidase family protein n=1 Tax=Spirosoma radiotolerans TaxID=1379870 RepID=UPI0006273315|nr:pyridoxamine 5'-phosphate oxidase family protein [Spirosoma radiotolerans]